MAEVTAPAAIDAAGCFSRSAVERLLKKVQRLGTLSETDDMALAGLLSTQLTHRQFVAGYKAPEPLSGRDKIKIVKRNPHTTDREQ